MRVEKSRCNVKTSFLHIFNINLAVFLEATVLLLFETSFKNRIGDTSEFMTKSRPVIACSWGGVQWQANLKLQPKNGPKLIENLF